MKAAVFSPYWDTLGGGEKYAVATVLALLEKGYDVEIWWENPSIVQAVEARYGLDIGKASLNSQGFKTIRHGSLLEKWQFTQKFDLIFWISDGSIPFLFGRKNLLHFQVPFHDTSSRNLITKIKMRKIYQVIVNSLFTKQVIDKEYGISSKVVYPPATQFKRMKKENLILSVGRFDNLMQSKRQDVLIDAFLQLPEANDWKLILAGGLLHGQSSYKDLEAKFSDKRITLLSNPTFDEISHLYGKAAIYWHAAGFGINTKLEPEKAEHFGIATVEAMSAGAVPVVYEAGGQKEIVSDSQDGYFWRTVNDLVEKTHHLMTHDKVLNLMSEKAHLKAQKYTLEEFKLAFNTGL